MMLYTADKAIDEGINQSLCPNEAFSNSATYASETLSSNMNEADEDEQIAESAWQKCGTQLGAIDKKMTELELKFKLKNQQTQARLEQHSETLIKQIKDVTTENQLLKFRLEELEPSSVDDKALQAMIPEPFNSQISTLPANIKKNIYDFHRQNEDAEWGYFKQQQISDFVRSHINFEYVNLAFVNCKIDTCEVGLSEKENAQTLAERGASAAEIQAFIDTKDPKYKQIFDDMRLNADLNMRTGVYMPNRFEIYMRLVDKNTSQRQGNLE